MSSWTHARKSSGRATARAAESHQRHVTYVFAARGKFDTLTAAAGPILPIAA
jgi:hypothetical protein